MDGRIGGPPVNGCHAASGARFDMASPSRDRVTIDLRGIGDAVRAAAACRGMGVAQLVRRALVMSLALRATATVAPVKGGSDGPTPDQAPARETAKLTLRLPQVITGNLAAVCHDDSAPDAVFQLTNISRPGMQLHSPNSFLA